MASAILGGLRRQGMPAGQITVVEPFEQARQQLVQQWGVTTLATPDASLQTADIVVWAIKPQQFKQAAQENQAFLSQALHLSVAAGISTDSLVQWLGSEHMVRAMPNTPALIGMGQTGLFARAGVTPTQRQWVESILQPTGALTWVDQESLLDAVTAISGSGPAYVFFFIEAMTKAAIEMGLSPAQAHQLAVGTFVGAAHLAQDAKEPPEVLRERVTSKGGTTHAAITSLQDSGVDRLFQDALKAAQSRAQELGKAFG